MTVNIWEKGNSFSSGMVSDSLEPLVAWGGKASNSGVSWEWVSWIKTKFRTPNPWTSLNKPVMDVMISLTLGLANGP